MANHDKYHNGQFQSNNSHSPLSSFNREENKSEDEIDLKQIFFTLWNRKWIIISSVLLCGLLAGMIAYLSTPIYQSNGSILIQNSQNSPGGLGGGEGIGQLLSSSYGLGAGSTLANELQILRSRRLSNAVADTLREERIMPNGRQYPILFKEYPDDSTLTSQDTVAARIRENIAFSKADRDADVVNIVFESPSPYEAAHVINMAMVSYKDLSTRENRSSANSAVNFLEKERTRIKNNLQDAEEELRKFMNNSKLVKVDPQTEKLIEQIAKLEARKQEARAKLQAANSAITQYEKQLNNIKPGLAEQYSEAIGSDIARLQYAKSELAVEKQQLLAKNPRLDESSPQIQEKNHQIEVYKKKIKELTQNLIKKGDQYLGFLGGGEASIAESVSKLNQKLIELKVEQQQYQSQIEVVNAQLNEQQQFFDSLPDNIIDLAKLKRDVKINEELFVTVSKQYAETSLWEQTQFGLGRIVDRAFVPNDPVKPNKIFYVLIGFIVGAALSIGYVLTRDALNTTIDGVEKMKKLPEPLLSVIPSMNDHIEKEYSNVEETEVHGKNISTNLITILDSISPVSESFRRLENNLIYSNPDTNLQSIMVTSSAKGEGKTTTISNLGVVLSEAGYKTLIVDTDFRRPNLHNMFGLKKTPGFMEVLFDDISLTEAIKETIAPGLSILPSGRRPPNAAAITQSKAFLELIKELETQYDFVLIDTPPFGIITDASAMMRQTHGVVVVAKFGSTTEIQLTQTLEHLHRLNANVMGTVLTAFDHTESSDYHLGSRYYKEIYKDYNTYKEEA